jgi:hypothetical protein
VAASRWGQAKREVIALKALIDKRLAEGFSARSIWMDLHTSGQVTVSLQKFTAQVRKLSESNSPTTGRDLVAGAVRPAPVTVPVNRQNAAQPLPQGEVGPTAAFVHNAQSSLDEQW